MKEHDLISLDADAPQLKAIQLDNNHFLFDSRHFNSLMELQKYLKTKTPKYMLVADEPD